MTMFPDYNADKPERPLKKPVTVAKHEAIRAHYAHWYDQKDGHVRMYTHAYCVNKCVKKFFMSYATIEKIVAQG